MMFLLFFILELCILFFLSRLLTQSLSSLFYKITKSQKATIHLLAIIFFPGIVIHELAHLLVANILFVPTGQIEFVPQITKHGVKLGSVEIVKTDPIRRMIIGFAPVFVGVAMLLSILYAIVQADVITKNIHFISLQVVFYVIAIYFLFVIGNTMFSSRKDMEGAAEVMLVVGGILFVLYRIGVRIDLFLLQGVLTSQEVLLKNIVILLSLPIAIDMGVWGITKMINGR